MKDLIEKDEPTTAKPSLKRVIGVAGLACACFNAIVGSGIFALPGRAAKLLGPAAILGYVVSLTLVGLVGLCFAEIGSRVHKAGGQYAYAHASFGPVVGGIAGTLTWSANSAVPSAAIAVFLVDTLAIFFPALNQTLARTLMLFVGYAFLATINIMGARIGARLSSTVAFCKIALLALLVGAGVFAIHPANLHWDHAPAATSIGKCAVILCFACMGVEGGLLASGEVMNSARTVPRAIAITLTLVAALYLGLQLVCQGVLGPALATTKAPLVDAAGAVWGPWGARLFLAATVVSAGGFLMADQLCSPRAVYALAESGQLPGKLAYVHPRFATPAAAIGAYAILCFTFAALGNFRQLLIIASSGSLTLYLISCLGLLRLRARNVMMDGEPFRAPGGAFVPLASAGLIVWMLSTLELRELAAAVGIVVVSGAAYAMHELGRRKRGREEAL